MRALVLKSFGGPEALRIDEIPTPEPGPGEIRVRVGAAFVARTRDVATRSGHHPVFSRIVIPPHILGGEHAGTVDAVGAGVDTGLVGTRVAVSAYLSPVDDPMPTVLGIHRPGSYAEYTVVPAANIEQIPDDVSFAEAAVLAANGPLARAQLEAGALQPSQWVLVPGASGSVGSILVALAARRGARVIALTRHEKATAPLRALGAEAVIEAGRPDLADALLELTGGGVDLVVDNLAIDELWKRYEPAIALFGRVVFSGWIGSGPLPVDVLSLYRKGQTLIGFRTGDANQVASLWSELRQDRLSIPPELIQEFPLAEGFAAHAGIEQGSKLGHYVITND